MENPFGQMPLLERVKKTPSETIYKDSPFEQNFSPAEIIRYQENRNFANEAYKGLIELLEFGDNLTPERVDEVFKEIKTGLKPPQIAVLSRIKQRVFDEMQKAKSIDIDALRETFKDDKGCEVAVSPLGIIILTLDREVYDRSPFSAEQKIGCMVKPEMAEIILTKDTFDQIKGLPVILLRGPDPYLNEGFEIENVRKHESFHALYNCAIKPEAKNLYNLPERKKNFQSVQDELSAYLIGNNEWVPALRYLLQDVPLIQKIAGQPPEVAKHEMQKELEVGGLRRAKGMGPKDTMQELEELKKLYQEEVDKLGIQLASMGPKAANELMPLILEKFNLRKKAEAAELKQGLEPMDYEIIQKNAAKHVTDLFGALREIARLELLDSKEQDEGIKSILFAQSFKEMAYGLSQIETGKQIDVLTIFKNHRDIFDLLTRINDAIFFNIPLDHVPEAIGIVIDNINQLNDSPPSRARDISLEYMAKLLHTLQIHQTSMGQVYKKAA